MKRRFIILLAATAALAPAVARATVIHVPADQPTIQAGVNAALDNDTVLVDEGIYHENVVINGTWVTLASHYILDKDPAHIVATVIDGSTPTSPDTGSCVVINNSLNAALIGFTLTGGTGTKWLDASDGLFYREGGGVLTDGGNPTVARNIIIHNRANDRTGVRSAGGGAIRAGFGNCTIVGNVIAYNDGRYGGGIVAFFNPAIIRNNVIFRNSGGQDFGGGGIWITSTSGAKVENNTILANSSTSDGGGVLIWSGSASLRNNIVRANTAGTGPQVRLRSGGTASFLYDNIEGGWAGTGIIDADPLFATPEFLLDPLSPCVDAGDPGSAYIDRPDLSNIGHALPPSQGTQRNDMGAYGGPDARFAPVFNSLTLAPATGAIDFDSVDVASTAAQIWHLNRQGFGILTVDSVVFHGSFQADLSTPRSLPLALGPLAADSLDSINIQWSPAAFGLLDDTLLIYHNSAITASPITITLHGTAPGGYGDPNLDGVITSSDIIYLVNFVFKGGTPPHPVLDAGDVNCDHVVTSSDIIFLVNYVFKGGPPPSCS